MTARAALFALCLVGLGACRPKSETPIDPAEVAAPCPDWAGPPASPFELPAGMTADDALDVIEDNLRGEGVVEDSALLALMAYGDSSRHFARTLDMIRRAAARDPDDIVTMHWLGDALVTQSSWRPFYRTLLRDAVRERDYGMVRAVVVMLGQDPRMRERAELDSLNRWLGDDRSGPLREALYYYPSRRFSKDDISSRDAAFRKHLTFDARLQSFVTLPVDELGARQFRELHRQRPAEVEAWIDRWTVPPRDGCEPPMTSEVGRDHFRIILSGPEPLFREPSLVGPMTPAFRSPGDPRPPPVRARVAVPPPPPPS